MALDVPKGNEISEEDKALIPAAEAYYERKQYSVEDINERQKLLGLKETGKADKTLILAAIKYQKDTPGLKVDGMIGDGTKIKLKANPQISAKAQKKVAKINDNQPKLIPSITKAFEVNQNLDDYTFRGENGKKVIIEYNPTKHCLTFDTAANDLTLDFDLPDTMGQINSVEEAKEYLDANIAIVKSLYNDKIKERSKNIDEVVDATKVNLGKLKDEIIKGAEYVSDKTADIVEWLEELFLKEINVGEPIIGSNGEKIYLEYNPDTKKIGVDTTFMDGIDDDSFDIKQIPDNIKTIDEAFTYIETLKDGIEKQYNKKLEKLKTDKAAKEKAERERSEAK